LGSVATIVKLINEGMIVHYIAFSISEETIPDGIDKTNMLSECEEATKNLVITSENLIIKRFQIRSFNQY